METPLKPQTPRIDSLSKNPEPVFYEFPESVIDKAKGITLGDLLDNPATQCWLISAISPMLVHMHQPLWMRCSPRIQSSDDADPGAVRLHPDARTASAVSHYI